MMRMRGLAMLSSLVVSLSFVTVIPVWAESPDAEALLHVLQSVSSNIELAVTHGTQGSGGQMAEHATQAIRSAEHAISLLPSSNPHAREAATLLQEAIFHLTAALKDGDNGRVSNAVDHVRVALDFSDAAAMHVTHGD